MAPKKTLSVNQTTKIKDVEQRNIEHWHFVSKMEKKRGVVGAFSPRRVLSAFQLAIKPDEKKGVRTFMKECGYSQRECRDPCIVKRVQRMAVKFKIPKEHWSANVNERADYLLEKIYDHNGVINYGFKDELFQRKPRKKESKPRARKRHFDSNRSPAARVSSVGLCGGETVVLSRSCSSSA